MNCKKCHTLLVDYLDKNLDEASLKEMQLQLQQCDSCKKALEEMEFLFDAIDKIPSEVPDESMSHNFKLMLQNEKLQQKTASIIPLSTRKKTIWKRTLQFAASFALLFAGYFYATFQYKNAQLEKFTILEQEFLEMKTEMTVALMEHQSASKRIQAVNYTQEFKTVDDDILKALINKLHHDNRINVRLAAATALSKFSDSQIVRSALIKALETAQNPSLQIELIQILGDIKEKNAVPVMERLLEAQEVPVYVKEEIQTELKQFI